MALTAKTTQQFVPIREVRDGIVILKDGGLRAVIAASSINLSLKSAEEQKAIISQFQAFLNSLDFSLQIAIQSRRYDVREYLMILEKKEKEQVEPLLRVQTKEYIEFVRNFVETHNIMTKNFYLVVPYDFGAVNDEKGFLQSFLPSMKGGDNKTVSGFEENRSQLDQRIGVVEQGLASLGVRTSQLGTEEVVELFFKVFNPGDVTSSMKMS